MAPVWPAVLVTDRGSRGRSRPGGKAECCIIHGPQSDLVASLQGVAGQRRTLHTTDKYLTDGIILIFITFSLAHSEVNWAND